jgi:lysophospholipase L1-like esterase
VPRSSSINPATDKPLTFSNSLDLTLPAGADAFSDPIDFKLAALSDLAITVHLDRTPQTQTSHPGSHATSYLTHGDYTAATALTSPKKVEHWFFLSGVDVTAPRHAAALIAFGDSITDGHGSTTDGNDRWPNALAAILHGNKRTENIGVLNEGIGGNHMLTDGLGPNALARFDRDALAPSGASTILLLEGINDLGSLARSQTPATPEQRAALLHALEFSYEQFVARAHAHGLRVIGATVLPYLGSDYYHPSAEDEVERLKLNDWIRQPGHFDAVVDFDRLTTDPSHPGHLLPAYDSGDHLHPSPAGYRAMAAAIPISALVAK